MNGTHTLTAVVLSLASVVGAGTAKADSYHHIDEMALDLQTQARELQAELNEHYRHTRWYDHLSKDAAEVTALAAELHSQAHYRGSLPRMQAIAARLDALVHHTEEMMGEIEYYQLSRYTRDHIHGDTRHVRSHLKQMASDIHHLESDLQELKPVVPIYQAPAPRFPYQPSYSNRYPTPSYPSQRAYPNQQAYPNPAYQNPRYPAQGYPTQQYPLQQRNYGSPYTQPRSVRSLFDH
ncbi:hypothetical protein [Lignipirellula cremea]|uniref:Uncharacterized protein n=1 Tax=Lignipirellula cremea TaxID=2528010 RepID=A0A518DUF0_9BACT|nr:hypothetical protein [Lignipirellula cremea]QDU95449.1 hypothetical protein Pla8534_32640 [Lignipirellula cremea]